MAKFSPPTLRLLGLLHDLGGIGHPKNPFADAVYGPRVPCADFTVFIEHCLADHDMESIIQLAEALSEDSPRILQRIPSEIHIPGLPPRPMKTKMHSPPPSSGLRQRIDGILSIDFSQYVTFVDQRGLDRLRAMIVWMASQNPDVFPDAFPGLLSWSLSAFLPRWQDGFALLAERARRSIRERLPAPPFYRKERSESGAFYWREITELPNVSLDQFPDPPIAIAQRVRKLTPGASMQLMYAIKRGGGYLPKLTEQHMRGWGIHEPVTSEEILVSGLLQVTSDPLTVVRKAPVEISRLVEACTSSGITCKSNWSKYKLIQALADNAPTKIREIAEDIWVEFPMVVELPPYLADDLKALLAYASGLVMHFYALSLACVDYRGALEDLYWSWCT